MWRRSVKFWAGLSAGFCAGVGFVIACGNGGNDSVAANGDPAKGIAYANTASGLHAQNVQDAIDEIGTKLSAAVGPVVTGSRGSSSLLHVRTAFAQSMGATTWTVTVTSPTSDFKSFESKTLPNIVLTPSAADRGTFAWVGEDDQFQKNIAGVPPSTPTGNYLLTGNKMFVTNTHKGDAAPAGATVYDVDIADGGKTLTLSDGAHTFTLTRP